MTKNTFSSFVIIIALLLSLSYLFYHFKQQKFVEDEKNNKETNINDVYYNNKNQQNNDGFFQYSAFTNYMPFIISENFQNFEPHINRLIMQKIEEAEENEPNYDCQSYLNRYPEIKEEFGESCRNIQTRMRAIGHWIQFGKKEKRNPTSIEKLTDSQKEELNKNHKLQMELLNEIEKLKAKNEEERQYKQDKDYRQEDKKKFCQARMNRAASSLRAAESKMDNARSQSNRAFRTCRNGPNSIS